MSELKKETRTLPVHSINQNKKKIKHMLLEALLKKYKQKNNIKMNSNKWELLRYNVWVDQKFLHVIIIKNLIIWSLKILLKIEIIKLLNFLL